MTSTKLTRGPFAKHLRTVLEMLEPYSYDTKIRFLNDVRMACEIDHDIYGATAKIIGVPMAEKEQSALS